MISFNASEVFASLLSCPTLDIQIAGTTMSAASATPGCCHGVDFCDVTDHDNGLTVWDPVHPDVNINSCSLVRINDPARRWQTIAVAAVHVVPAIKLRTRGSFALVPEFVSAVISRDAPVVRAVDEIWWQLGQFSVVALGGPVDDPTLQETVPVPC
jgi:hypothetical protein